MATLRPCGGTKAYLSRFECERPQAANNLARSLPGGTFLPSFDAGAKKIYDRPYSRP
jgi:hypothetical protein